MIVRGVILGLDRQRQRFDGAQMQRGHLFGVLLLVFQALQIEAVGAVNQIHHRSGEQHRLPAHEYWFSRLATCATAAPPR